MKYMHILLKPDVFIRNILEDILLELEKRNTRFYSYDLISPNIKLLDIMHLHDFKWKYDYFSHNYDFFKLGPSLSLICKNPDIETNYKDLVKEFKGAALPILDEGESIRKMFSVSDRCINVIHISDTLIQSKKEIKSVLNFRKDVELFDLSETLTIDEIIKGVDTLKGDGEYLFQNIVDIIKMRILHKNNICTSFLGNVNIESLFEYSPIYLDQKLEKSYNRLDNRTDILLKKATKSALQLHRCFCYGTIEERLCFVDYFFSICERLMIYLSSFEKYVIESEARYKLVNKE